MCPCWVLYFCATHIAHLNSLRRRSSRTVLCVPEAKDKNKKIKNRKLKPVAPTALLFIMFIFGSITHELKQKPFKSPPNTPRESRPNIKNPHFITRYTVSKPWEGFLREGRRVSAPLIRGARLNLQKSAPPPTPHSLLGRIYAQKASPFPPHKHPVVRLRASCACSARDRPQGIFKGEPLKFRRVLS